MASATVTGHWLGGGGDSGGGRLFIGDVRFTGTRWVAPTLAGHPVNRESAQLATRVVSRQSGDAYLASDFWDGERGLDSAPAAARGGP